jgi:xylulose-5-phosphate/fructose-6-phosphate phosphoketolase
VLPVQHLNGYKIANPTVLARIPTDELTSLLRGYGYEPHFVGGDDPTDVHEQLAITLDEVLDTIAAIQHNARGAATSVGRPARPMIVLRTPKGWTGPAEVDGVQVEGTFRAHQVPLSESRTNAGHRAQLELWLRSYRPEELFDQDGQLIPALRALAPHGTRRMSANPNANGGLLLRHLVMPDFRQHAVEVDRPAAESSEATKVLGAFLRDTITANPDCSGCYEAFIHIIDSMVNQHAKWLKTTRGIPWQAPIASLNYLLTSHVWRQDHSGYSHQDPGFIDHMVNKKAEIVRV